MPTSVRWVPLPENRSARAAVGILAEAVAGGQSLEVGNPLLVHGPAGAGKTHLVEWLAGEVVARAADRIVVQLAAGDFRDGDEAASFRDDVTAADLVIVEDLQRLPEWAAAALANWLDEGVAAGQAWVFTANVGPAELIDLPMRLTSRLSSGLVVRLGALGLESRLEFLRQSTARRGLVVEDDALLRLATDAAGSVRQLKGLVVRLEALPRLPGRMLSTATVGDHFRVEAETKRASVEQLVERVSGYFHVQARQVRGPGRTRDVLLARQVAMSLARSLTGLSLERIGAFFGGRDHTTVMHACRKVDQQIATDLALAAAVRQLHADFA
jgi:chromosomal replication initiator protein